MPAAAFAARARRGRARAYGLWSGLTGLVSAFRTRVVA